MFFLYIYLNQLAVIVSLHPWLGKIVEENKAKQGPLRYFKKSKRVNTVAKLGNNSLKFLYCSIY